MLWYCPLPFKFAFIDSTGISPCCHIARQPVSLEHWPNNQRLKQIQSHAFTTKWPTECRTCQEREKTLGTSLRLQSMADYENQYYGETEIDWIDYRASNICNFKCRTCHPTFSHGISNEVKNHPELTPWFVGTENKTVNITDAHTNWVLDNLHLIKRIMFTGGEPTVMPETRHIIEEIYNNHKQIKIMITSNGSFTDPFWKKITVNNPNIHWTLSIDAVGAPAEIIRHGTVWSMIESNAEWLVKNSASFSINSVISRLNILHLRTLWSFVRKLQSLKTDINGCEHLMFIVQKPQQIMAVNNMPDDLNTQALEHLEHCRTLDLDQNQKEILERLINLLSIRKFDPELWQKDLGLNSIYDKLRGEDHTVLYKGNNLG